MDVKDNPLWAYVERDDRDAFQPIRGKVSSEFLFCAISLNNGRLHEMFGHCAGRFLIRVGDWRTAARLRWLGEGR